MQYIRTFACHSPQYLTSSMHISHTQGQIYQRLQRRIPLKSLKHNCEAYRKYYKKLPGSLEALVHTPDNRRIIEEVPIDPWGKPYYFESDGLKIKLYSSGSDGLPNTIDDIVVNIE